MAVPNPALREKSRKFLDAESVTARRGQTVKLCGRAAVSLPPSLQLVEIVSPLLHHAAALGEILRVVVGGADPIAFVMASWRSIQSGWNPISFRIVDATARKPWTVARP